MNWQSYRFSGGVPVAKSDTEPVNTKIRAFLIGGAGNLNVKFSDGSTALLKGLAAGSIIWLDITHVLSTNTTATDVVGLW